MSVAVKSEAGVAPPSRERVELILHQLDRLPTLPPITARVLALTTSDRSSVRDLVEVIELDPALTAGILRLTRRADLGVPQQGMNVGRAVSLLGFNAVRNAVLCNDFFELFPARGPEQDDGVRRRLWLHSIAVACACEWVAERLGRVELGDAFVCGLLHDIGKIALESSLPKSYRRAIERAEARRESLCDAEQELFGLDHTVAGKRLATRWGLPQAVIEAVWLHHQAFDALPSFVASANCVKTVRLADEVARSLGLDGFGMELRGETEAISHSLGLAPSAFDALVAALPARMAPLLEVLGLDGAGEEGPTVPLQMAYQRLRQVCGELSDENRTLQTRAKLFEMVCDFMGRRRPGSSVADVCQAAAQSLCTVIQADGVCVFAADPSRDAVHVGYCAHGHEASFTTMSRDDALEDDSWQDSRTAGRTNGRPRHDSVWRHCFGWAPAGPLRYLPLRMDQMEGGILMACKEEAAALAGSAEWGTAAQVVGNALASACAEVESERTTEELLDLNRRLREAQAGLLRMRSIAMVSEMAAGAAHEMNNPLAVISGRAQMELANTDDPDRRRAMEVIIAQTNKAAQIVLDLMTFAKPDPPSPIEQSLADVLRAVFQHWRDVLGPQAHKLSVTPPAGEVTVYADAGQLVTVLNEIIANAVGAADSAEGRVRINSDSRASDETVRITIEDNGIGMTPDVVEHAIDPFFSSRPAGRGRGLGLSKAYRLMEINGGRLWLESKPNVGTTVSIELPARAPNPA